MALSQATGAAERQAVERARVGFERWVAALESSSRGSRPVTAAARSRPPSAGHALSEDVRGVARRSGRARRRWDRGGEELGHVDVVPLRDVPARLPRRRAGRRFRNRVVDLVLRARDTTADLEASPCYRRSACSAGPLMAHASLRLERSLGALILAADRVPASKFGGAFSLHSTFPLIVFPEISPPPTFFSAFTLPPIVPPKARRKFLFSSHWKLPRMSVPAR